VTIPLVRARYAHSFAVTLDALGVPVEPLLRAHRLPSELVSQQDGLITAYQLWTFVGDAARREGHSELGLVAGKLPVVEHGNFGKQVYQAVTLYDAIQTFCINAVKEYSRADFYLRQDEYMAWFCRGPIDGDATQSQQVELYVLAMMIDTIRLSAGTDWQPRILYLQNRDMLGLRDNPLLRIADTRFGNEVTAIGFPRTLLSKPLRGEISAFTRPENKPGDIFQHADFVSSLRAVLKSYLPYTPISLDITAEITGIKPRTLQRQLSEFESSFKEIIDQVRFETAVALMQDEKSSLLDIALEVGYSDAAHFTRAFRRWAGTSPREYRRLHAA
jgi:AraC-like DNA-binding protein